MLCKYISIYIYVKSVYNEVCFDTSANEWTKITLIISIGGRRD